MKIHLRNDSLSWLLPGNLSMSGDSCSGSGRQCVSGGRLAILILTVEHQGTFTCLAANQFGTTSRSVRLTVKVSHPIIHREEIK